MWYGDLAQVAGWDPSNLGYFVVQVSLAGSVLNMQILHNLSQRQ